jgi:hypothetical protein
MKAPADRIKEMEAELHDLEDRADVTPHRPREPSPAASYGLESLLLKEWQKTTSLVEEARQLARQRRSLTP